MAACYPILFLDALHLKLRREGKIENVAVYIVYVTYSDQKEFMRDLKGVYRAATREEGETTLLLLAEKYPAVLRSWENN